MATCRRSAAQWEQLIGEMQRRGEHPREAAERLGVALGTLEYWYYRLRRRGAPTPEASAVPAASRAGGPAGGVGDLASRRAALPSAEAIRLVEVQLARQLDAQPPHVQAADRVAHGGGAPQPPDTRMADPPARGACLPEPPSAAGRADLALELPAGLTLRFPVGSDIPYLTGLVAALSDLRPTAADVPTAPDPGGTGMGR